MLIIAFYSNLKD